MPLSTGKRAILDLGENPRPRGYDKVEGTEGIYRIWVGRDWRVLYSINPDRNELVLPTALTPGPS